jgi:hypothetical protein
MLGFCGCCATAGVTADVAVAANAIKPGQMLLAMPIICSSELSRRSKLHHENGMKTGYDLPRMAGRCGPAILVAGIVDHHALVTRFDGQPAALP